MKARYALSVFVAAALAVVMVSCGKKESSETAPASTPAPAAAPVDTANAGAVSGAVKLEGKAPKARTINMAAEPSCAAEHATTPAVDEEVVTGDGGALVNVVIYVKEGLANRTFEAPKTPVTIDQRGCQYKPHVVALMAGPSGQGQPLNVINSDKTTHNIHPTPKNNREWNKSQAPGSPKIEEFFGREEISIPVKCNVHPWMKSYIAVFKHPYFQVSGTNGSFELKDLPPGNYTIEAWHEKYGTTSQSVTIAPKETKTITFTFKAS